MVFIVFEGLDRSGKTTQCRLLIEHLQSIGLQAHAMRYPDRKGALTGALLNEFLLGGIEMSPPTSSRVFAANLWDMSAMLQAARDSNEFYVMDRYVWSGIAYSVGRGEERPVYEGILSPLPKPDLTIYMNVNLEELIARDGYGGERFEKPEFQRIVDREMRQLIAENGKWGPVHLQDASGSIEKISSDIALLLKDRFSL